MGRMSRERVAVQELSSKYLEYLYVFRIVSGIKFWWIFQNGSGMVPETLHISSEDILGQGDEDPVPSICKCQTLYYSVCSAQQLFRKDC